jgi:hypothetical protein
MVQLIGAFSGAVSPQIKGSTIYKFWFVHW